MNTRKYSAKQEKRIAKDLNGKRQSNSGATSFEKGDIKMDCILIEAKTQIEPKKSFTVKKEWLDKNKEEAFSMGKQYSALAFNFGGLNDKDDYYIIDKRTMKLLVEYLEENE
jgi:hypothetical protein